MPNLALRRLGVTVLTGLCCLVAGTTAHALPSGSDAFCNVYPDTPACVSGTVGCTSCHTVPPARNVYGAQISEELAVGEMRPLSEDVFLGDLPDALKRIEALDADDDGFSNLDELIAGADPSDATIVPADAGECSENATRPTGLDVCAYDPVYVYKKIMLDFCGIAPTYEEMNAFAKEPSTDALHALLDVCLDSEYWIGKDGVLWNMANRRIRPIQAIKSGPDDPGPIPLADYYDDYNFFVYSMSDDRDVRTLLTGDYWVERADNPTIYTPFQRNLIEDFNIRGYEGAQAVSRGQRAGMITHRWFLMSNTMFTGIPRTTASQAYRAYLGMDISKLEGLYPIRNEPVDYDNKGVKREECAICHSTLDPLTYPFAAYEGIGGGSDGDYIPFSYNPSRLSRFKAVDGDNIVNTPRSGYIFGQEVANLTEWADVAANSDAFASALVKDFWKILIGEYPRATEFAEFNTVWKQLKNEDAYNAEKMLHNFIMTEAYGVP